MNTFRIEMLPAAEGDALWVEYGDPAQPRYMLVDGGVFATYDRLVDKIAAMRRRRLELLVVTHVDNDHIDAVVKLLGRELGVTVGDMWFNAWAQIRGDKLGAKQGEMLTSRIKDRRIPHHRLAKNGPIGIPSDPRRKLQRYGLLGGMRLTVLGPAQRDIVKLRAEWKAIIEGAGLKPGGRFTGAKLIEAAPKYHKDRLGARPPNVAKWANRAFEKDTTAPNGSSITFLAEYRGRSVLFGADAHCDTLIEGIDRLLEERGIAKLRLDAFKVPHHGSKHNVSNELMSRIDCRSFLISTSGNRFEHPDDDAIARLIYHSNNARLHFNYRSKENKDWGRDAWQSALGHEAIFPTSGDGGLVFEMDAT